jgi:methanogenic corrinoid protein MtbC1
MAHLDKNTQGMCSEDSGEGGLSNSFLGQMREISFAMPPDPANATLAGIVEAEIIPRLLLVNKGRVFSSSHNSAAKRETISPEDVEVFCEIVRSRQIDEIDSFVSSICARGVDTDSVMLNLLAPTARLLGRMWERDESDFATVTISLCRLQQALRKIAGQHGQTSSAMKRPHRILLATSPGDQHNFGLLIVDEFLHRAGWDVCSLPAATGADIERRVKREAFEIAGLSLSQEALLPDIESLIANIRRGSLNKDISIMVGGCVFAERPDLVAKVGADALALDGRDAVTQAEKLVAALQNSTGQKTTEKAI